ncbi:hypothetical protein FRB99_003578 [Tulasnella sp. 403]|nr:hypothetical protein FRB99_003578 [Tulasnella sp. 403]
MTLLYGARHLDIILGFSAPEPLARLYSRSYYRATWIATALDAGFASAMSIRQKWLRDIFSLVFSLYYLVFANSADERLRKFRAVCTVEMMRATWEKTSNPYIRTFILLHLPKMPIRRKITLPRPSTSKYSKPMTAWLFFAGSEVDLAQATDLVFDCPGGGFVAMTPEHHEERLRLWSYHSRKPVISIEYGKAPEYPYPWAVDEVFDAYQAIVADKGRLLGMSGKRLDIILTGDSAGGNLAVCTMLKILESPTFIPRPLALVLSYPALDFNYTSWMSPSNLAVLRSEASSAYIPGLDEQKDHLSHKSPLSMIDDVHNKRLRRSNIWKRSLSESFSKGAGQPDGEVVGEHAGGERTRTATVPMSSLPTTPAAIRKNSGKKSVSFRPTGYGGGTDSEDTDTDTDRGSDTDYPVDDDERPILARVMTSEAEFARRARDAATANAAEEVTKDVKPATKIPLGTRLTMTSRSGYFQDRIISPSMMRAMAILYIGPNQLPDFERDYYVSPILAPDALLAQFPTVLLNCGEKDPFVDDTVIFAGRIRQAKQARREQVAKAVKARAVEYGQKVGLYSSTSFGAGSPRAMPGMDDPLRILAESDEDWVQMRIVEGWSHGYLQMLTLIPQVKVAIQHLAAWTEEVFASHERARAAGSEPKEEVCEEIKTPMPRRVSKFASNGRRRRGTLTSETETDDQLTFVPRKKRSPPASFSNIQEEMVREGQGGREPRNSSSGETLNGPMTPESGIEGYIVSPATSASAKRPEANAGECRILDGPVEQRFPHRESDVSGKSVRVGDGVKAQGGLAATTGGTPLFAKGSLEPLSEAELMKRRRQEAVLGLVAGDQVVHGGARRV